MANCIDLKKRFWDRYQVVHEDSYQAERGEDGRLHDPWLLTIPCKHGHIYPHGGQYLAASTNHRGPVANQLAALPCVRVVQDGDDGVNAFFRRRIRSGGCDHEAKAEATADSRPARRTSGSAPQLPI